MNTTELNISDMNDLELKGTLHAWLEKVKNRLELEQLAEFMRPSIEEDKEEEDSWNEIPPFHQERILNSYKESFNPDNWINHEDVKKQHAKWLQK